MSGFTAKAVIVVIVLLVIAIIISRAFRRPNSPKMAAKQQRMPMLVLLVGIGLLAIGFFLTLGAFTSPYNAQLLPMRIAGVTVFVAGLAVVFAHRSWYLETGTDAVRYRTILGREHRIAYADVTSCRRVGEGSRERLLIRSASGEKLTVNLARYDASRILAAVPAS